MVGGQRGCHVHFHSSYPNPLHTAGASSATVKAPRAPSTCVGGTPTPGSCAVELCSAAPGRHPGRACQFDAIQGSLAQCKNSCLLLQWPGEKENPSTLVKHSAAALNKCCWDFKILRRVIHVSTSGCEVVCTHAFLNQ